MEELLYRLVVSPFRQKHAARRTLNSSEKGFGIVFKPYCQRCFACLI